MTGELLAGRYQLEQELGRGGMATVFLALDLRLSRRVAVKVLHPGLDARFTERFRQEAEVVASLQHPNVLAVHDLGEDAVRGPFLVCEWVQGENLRELARRLAPLPPEAVALLGWELARALDAAHARGVVHRDVKPENVLVARGGPLKLADFGIAALADQARLTSTGAVIGSLPYMAPERMDTGAWSPASDVYAVGVVLFELCTGSTPHAGEGSARLAVSVMTRDAPPLVEAAPGTPAPLSALVARCLARDARDRPGEGGALAQELEAVLRPWVGAPAEASRAFFQAPESCVARWREDRFQRLLGEGRALLAAGQGARAARCLNAALALRPGAPEVLALLRSRPMRKGLARSAWEALPRSWAEHKRAFLAALVLAAVSGGLGPWAWRAGGARSPAVATGQASAPATDSDATVQTAVPVAPAAGSPATSEDLAALAPGDDSTATNAVSAALAPGDDATATMAASASAPPGAGLPATSEASAAPVAVARLDSAQSPSRPLPQAAAGTPVRGARPEAPGRSPRAAPAPLARPAQDSLQRPVSPEPPGDELPVRVPEARDFATLTVATRPWAEVFVDGQSRGYTPRLRELRLSPGTHRLRFANPLCEPVEEVLEVAAGAAAFREVSLRVRDAEVTLVAPAASRVFVDGVEVGVAPLRDPLKLSHGVHLLSVRDPGGHVLRQSLDAVAGTHTTIVLGAAP
ncbi:MULTISPECIES: serine/threonine-protein kinase [Corallococcus]|uniref:serine/threonine-protein kinase n=1 Tax=Corallococcus TaxID=83461 RepID=UPI000ED79219|nr:MULTISPECIES: serine/threonine-protein kinase [Corallococcus]NPC69940.1 protein kinase [Corallococcus exiguus]NPD24321.1 protein kinase [Corallococcus exiguus]RKH99629.1 serine/threonine protein kinase [Corallococcus sp. AB038B]